MDLMDIQAVESKLSDVTVTPIPRSQVANFYNFQQQREQREQQPQIQISAIHHTPRNEHHRTSHNSDHGNNNNSYGSGSGGSLRDNHLFNSTQGQQLPSGSTVAAVMQYTQQLQAQLALLQQQKNNASGPSSSSAGSSASITAAQLRNLNVSINGGMNLSAVNNNNQNNANNTAAMLKYPQSTSPLITTQTSANITTPLTSTANLPSIGTSSNSNGLTKYAQLLAVIEEMCRDIRPTYTGSRSSTERLKRGIVHARILVRECLMEAERSARQ